VFFPELDDWIYNIPEAEARAYEEMGLEVERLD